MVQQGYPKLAIYNPVNTDFKLPFWRDKHNQLPVPKNHKSSIYGNVTWHKLIPNELIILVHDWYINRYYPLNGKTQFLCYHVVPLSTLEKDLIPKTSIYKWKSSYDKLPLMAAEELTIVNKDELERQMKRENKYSLQSKRENR